MDNSLKIGAVSGLVAGIAAAIIWIFMIIISLYTGLTIDFLVGNFANMPAYTIIAITLTVIWGIVLGIIYSRVHQVISDRVVNKGLLYGFFCGLIFQIRDASFLTSYAVVDPLTTLRVVIATLIAWIPFGLVLATLYERWHKEERQETVTYDMKSGIHPGAIAGFIGGVLAYFFSVFYPYIGLWPPMDPGYLTDPAFMISQFGTHVFIHLLWGVIFGAVFARVYNVVPRKGIVKGFYYGLIIFIVSSVQTTTWHVARGIAFNNIAIMWWGIAYFIFDVFVLPLYGLVLGYLYRKPSD